MFTYLHKGLIFPQKGSRARDLGVVDCWIHSVLTLCQYTGLPD